MFSVQSNLELQIRAHHATPQTQVNQPPTLQTHPPVHGLLRGHIEDDRHQVRIPQPRKPLGVRGLAHTGIDDEAVGGCAGLVGSLVGWLVRDSMD